MSSDEQIQCRFRHHCGDIGPITFHESATVAEVKDKVIAEWPKEGLLAKELPSQAADIRLILSGKYVDNAKPLREYKKDMGEIKPDTIVTMHLVIRPQQQAAKQQGTVASTEKHESKGCGCIIS